jgi:3-deoxy-D-manno-octulosonic-acid transferase
VTFDRRDREAALLPGAPDAGNALLFVHTTGELRRFYALADLAFVGATLTPLGGHSLFEVAELGVPVLHGPHTATVSDVAAALAAEAGGFCVAGGAELAAQMAQLMASPAALEAASEGAYRAAERLGGAVGRTVAALRSWGFPLPPTVAGRA